MSDHKASDPEGAESTPGSGGERKTEPAERLRSGLSKAVEAAKSAGQSTAAGVAAASKKTGELGQAGARNTAASRRSSVTSEGHPVLFGVLALAVVAIAVGLVLALATLMGTRAVGLGESNSGPVSASQETMFLPSPEPTATPEGPLVTLAPDPNETSTDTPKPPKSTEEGGPPISLSVFPNEVPPMGQIDLTGTYPKGEGSILQVQVFESGEWRDFPVTVSVSNQTFTTFVQIGRTGENRIRVVDTDGKDKSNDVKVRVTGG